MDDRVDVELAAVGEPDPDAIRMGMPVDVVYEIAPRKDAEGNEYLTYYFKPRA